MDVSALDLVLFVASTFLAALVAGLAGFAFGLVAAAVWLHVLTPVQTASLIVAFGLIVQGVAVWKLRHALQWVRLWPFLVGGALGVPIGVMALSWGIPGTMRLAIGAVLILYGAYALVRPTMRPVKRGGAAADAAVGILNGLLGRPLPAQPRDFPEPLSREDKKQNDRSIRIPDLPRPIPDLAQLIVGQDPVARLLSGSPDADAGGEFQIPWNAPIEECANVFEGMRSLTRGFDTIQYGQYVLVGDAIKWLRPLEVPREVP